MVNMFHLSFITYFLYQNFNLIQFTYFSAYLIPGKKKMHFRTRNEYQF